MSEVEDPAERESKRIKLDSNCTCSKKEKFHDAQNTTQSLPKPVAILSEEYTRTIDTVPVYVAELRDPKLASRCIRELKELYPLRDFQHLKRIRRLSTHHKKKQVLQIILRIACQDELNNVTDAKDVVDGVSSEGLGKTYMIKVPKHSPLTREQFVKASELWPVNFHEDKYIEKLLSGELFDDSAVRKIYRYMDMAQKAALTGKNKGMVAMGAVVVDPSSDDVIAVAYDLCRHGHPLHHAIMVVIDLVAQSQNGGTWNMGYQQESGTWTLPENLDDIKKDNKALDYKEISKENASKLKSFAGYNKNVGLKRIESNEQKDIDNNQDKSLNENKNGPYLCTGYDLYVTKEPCIMCSMTLVHSRIRRVFYGCKDPTIGALGSKYHLHTQDGLNHHFEVFCGVLEQECAELLL